MKKIIMLTAVPLIFSGQLMAAAYKLPESSAKSTALSAAYVANAQGADAAYYNPAALSFNEDRSQMEADITHIHLTSITHSAGGSKIDETEEETFVIPTFHYSSPAVGNFRFGFSAVSPGGLSKRWKGPLKASAEEFTLETFELNPSAAYKVNEMVSVAGGLRAVTSSGVVKSSSTASRDLEGDSIDFGYNLAVMVKPTDELSLAATYRSNIDLTIEGTAELTNSVMPAVIYDGDAEVTVPLPATLSLAAAYRVNDATTLEFVYERTYWSAYDELDFDYDTNFVGHPIYNAFDAPGEKKWDDSNTFRLGLTHQLNTQWTLLAAIAYDETPIDKTYVGYELPDSDAMIYSVGAIYQHSEDLSFKAGFLYDQKEKLEVKASDNNVNGIVGEFEDASAYLITVGLDIKF